MFNKKEKEARARVYKSYKNMIRDEEYKHNTWSIKHYKKNIIFHSIFLIFSILFLIYLFWSYSTFNLVIWLWNLGVNIFIGIKQYKLFKKEQLNTLELDKQYYPEKYLKSERIKKFKNLKITL